MSVGLPTAEPWEDGRLNVGLSTAEPWEDGRLNVGLSTAEPWKDGRMTVGLSTVEPWKDGRMRVGLSTAEPWEDGRRDKVRIAPAAVQLRHDGKLPRLAIERLHELSVVAAADGVDAAVAQTQRPGGALEAAEVNQLARGGVEAHQLRDVLTDEVDVVVDGHGAVDADLERPRHLHDRPRVRQPRHEVLDVVLDDKQLVATLARGGREDGLDQVWHVTPFVCQHTQGPSLGYTGFLRWQYLTPHTLVSLNRLSVGCGTTPRRQSGYLVGFCLFIRVIYTMLPPHGH